MKNRNFVILTVYVCIFQRKAASVTMETEQNSLQHVSGEGEISYINYLHQGGIICITVCLFVSKIIQIQLNVIKKNQKMSLGAT